MRLLKKLCRKSPFGRRREQPPIRQRESPPVQYFASGISNCSKKSLLIWVRNSKSGLEVYKEINAPAGNPAERSSRGAEKSVIFRALNPDIADRNRSVTRRRQSLSEFQKKTRPCWELNPDIADRNRSVYPLAYRGLCFAQNERFINLT